jgi:hypothetical protein
MQLRPAALTVYSDVRTEDVPVVDVPSDDEGPVFRARGGVVKARQERAQASRARKATRGRKRPAPGRSSELDIQEIINSAMEKVPDDRLAELNAALSTHNRVVSAQKDVIMKQEQVIEAAQKAIELSWEVIRRADDALRHEIEAIINSAEDEDEEVASPEGEVAASPRDAVSIILFLNVAFSHSLVLFVPPFVFNFSYVLPHSLAETPVYLGFLLLNKSSVQSGGLLWSSTRGSVPGLLLRSAIFVPYRVAFCELSNFAWSCKYSAIFIFSEVLSNFSIPTLHESVSNFYVFIMSQQFLVPFVCVKDSAIFMFL